jgi:hypothetical protein
MTDIMFRRDEEKEKNGVLMLPDGHWVYKDDIVIVRDGTWYLEGLLDEERPFLLTPPTEADLLTFPKTTTVMLNKYTDGSVFGRFGEDFFNGKVYMWQSHYINLVESQSDNIDHK